MWAQLISMHLKDGGEADLPKVLAELRAIEQPESGLLRSITMRDENGPWPGAHAGRLRERREGASPGERSTAPRGVAGDPGCHGRGFRRRARVRQSDRRPRTD